MRLQTGLYDIKMRLVISHSGLTGQFLNHAAVKAAKILPLVGLARSKQDPINCGHGAQ